jgi:arylsulfatase A-like enzyme
MAVVLAAAVSGCSGQPDPDQSTKSLRRPPIIIIDIDTLRADHLSCYGHHRSTSPRIDALAEESVLFEWAFAQAPNTPPSQASILTGLYPTTHGRISDDEIISDEVVTLAEVLRRDGYETAAFVDGGLMAGRYGYGQGFEIYDDEGGHLEVIGPKVEGWLEERLGDPARSGRPFLLLVHTYDVHSPYENTPEPHRSMFLSDVDEPPRSFRSNMSGIMAEVWKTRHSDEPRRLDRVQMDWAVAMYDGGIHHVDDWYGRFEDVLEDHDLLRQTMVVVISDHGDEFQEHGSLFHDRLYATVTRIPMIIAFPERRWTARVSQAVESIDLVPTLLETVGSEIPDPVQGRSLLPLARGDHLAPRIAISESPFYGRRLAAADEQDRMLLTVRDGTHELYQYRDDPLEQVELADLKAEVVERLRHEISGWRARVDAHRYPRAIATHLDTESEEELRVLGYLD